MSFLTAATYRGSYASVGPNLSAALKHDCSRHVYPGLLDSLAPVGPAAGPNCSGALQPGTCARYDPSSFSNFQWLQSVRVFPDGTGIALVHNEVHAELSGNRSLCTHDPKYQLQHPHSRGDCILWSTDLGASTDGGATWHLKDTAVFTLPHRLLLNNPHEGYGALGSMVQYGGYYYGHVFRMYSNRTGAGPPGTAERGVCAWRARDPADKDSYRGWNGSAWSSRWINPYTASAAALAPGELWKYTCASIDTGGDMSSHPVPRVFASAGGGARDWRPHGWPSHVLFGWPSPSNIPAYMPQQTVSFAFAPTAGSAAAGGDAAFTAWGPAQYLSLRDWVDPATYGGSDWTMRYPTLLDHDSPFGLSQGVDAAARADGLSYTLVGNRSLYLYCVLVPRSKTLPELRVRLPVAWFAASATTPPAPFQPAPRACTAASAASAAAIKVAGAGSAAVNGVYLKTRKTSDAAPVFELDERHQLYRLGGAWRLGHMSVGVYYLGSKRGGGGLPGPGAWVAEKLGQAPGPSSLTCEH